MSIKKYRGLILLLLVAFMNVKATDWFPVGAKWNWGHLDGCCPHYNIPFTWDALRDTLIQTKTCMIIERKQIGETNNQYIYHSENNIITRYISNKFLPVYDFNKNVGDTSLVVTDSGTNACDSFKFIIDSIKQLPEDNQLNVQYGRLLKNGNCSLIQLFNFPIKIIEKIGLSYLDRTYYFFSFDAGIDSIRCYKDTNTDIHFVNYVCDTLIINSVKERLNPDLQVKIFPNPAYDKFQIDIKNYAKYKDISINLLDIQGKTLKYMNSNNHFQNCFIDVSDISNGMYFLKIVLDDEYITDHIIVNH